MLIKCTPRYSGIQRVNQIKFLKSFLERSYPVYSEDGAAEISAINYDEEFISTFIIVTQPYQKKKMAWYDGEVIHGSMAKTKLIINIQTIICTPNCPSYFHKERVTLDFD